MAQVWVSTNRASGEKTPFIKVRVEFRLSVDQLADGLCSAYCRNRVDDDGPLPERLSASRILEVVRDQYEAYGSNAVWTWSDRISEDESEECSLWAKDLILRAFPDLDSDLY